MDVFQVKEMDDLTILSVIENDNGLFELMVKSVLKFTEPSPKFIICDNTNGNNQKRIELAFGDYKNYQIIRHSPTLNGGSNRHGAGLGEITSLVETKKVAIIESDCVVLNKDWHVISPQYKLKAAKKTGELYHICFLICWAETLNGVDFRPGLPQNRTNRNYKVWEDVGWRLKEKVKSNEVQLMDFVDCKMGQGQIFNNQFQSDEFWENGKIIAGHFGRGSNLGGKSIKIQVSHKDQLARWKEIATKIIAQDKE